jgi:hypothetical protein
MKMVTRVLLGSAAAMLSVGAQAADLPVKAKPVEYVKICSQYGEGFYYIPGTDTCLKIGGYVRADFYWNAAGGGNPNYTNNSATGQNGRATREVNQFQTRHRANILFDSRTSTDYGTLRTVESVHFQNENQGTDTFTLQRAFIQWAGFTIGHAQSFIDVFYLDPYQFATPYIGGSSDGNGVNLLVYSWQFAGGFTFTTGIEERRKAGPNGRGRPVVNLTSPAALVVGAQAVDTSNGEVFPDFEAVLRLDQPWGTLGGFVVGHDASAAYYSTGCAQPGTTLCNHPSDELGFAGGVGGTINLPMIAPGDKIGGQFTWSNGAAAYAANGHNSEGLFGSGNQVAVAWLTDGVFVTGSKIELTTAWSLVAAYEHAWSPQVRTSLYGAYLNVDYNATATRYFCVAGTAAVAQAAFNTMSNCNPDYHFWYVGSRTLWSPVKDFILGVDVTFTEADTAFKGIANVASGIGTRPTGIYQIKDQGIVSATVRAQRTF